MQACLSGILQVCSKLQMTQGRVGDNLLHFRTLLSIYPSYIPNFPLGVALHCCNAKMLGRRRLQLHAAVESLPTTNDPVSSR